MEIELLKDALEEALGEMKFGVRDKAAVELAKNLAGQMDVEEDSTLLLKLGDLYLKTLEALQMTPRARAMAQKGVPVNDKPASSLDQLAAARARKSGAAIVDASAT